MNKTSNMKLIGPQRFQIEMQFCDLDALLPSEHKARDIWEFVEAMDSRPCFDYVNTFTDCKGRPTTSPKILLALWLQSILDGNLSARKLEELCKHHNAYKWLAGRAPINRTMLAEFRSKNPLKFEELLTNCLVVMAQAGLLEDRDFSQDGVRIKANAGNNSYRREESLRELQKSIKTYIRELCTDAEGSYDKRAKKKKRAIAEDRLKRIEEALEILEKERESKKENAKKNNNAHPSNEDLKEVRVSITDPVVRRMKIGPYRFYFYSNESDEPPHIHVDRENLSAKF